MFSLNVTLVIGHEPVATGHKIVAPTFLAMHEEHFMVSQIQHLKCYLPSAQAQTSPSHSLETIVLLWGAL